MKSHLELHRENRVLRDQLARVVRELDKQRMFALALAERIYAAHEVLARLAERRKGKP